VKCVHRIKCVKVRAHFTNYKVRFAREKQLWCRQSLLIIVRVFCYVYNRSFQLWAQPMLGWLRTLLNCSYCMLHTYTRMTYMNTSHYFRTGRANDRLAVCAINTHWLLYGHPLSGEVAYSNRLDRTTDTLRLPPSNDRLAANAVQVNNA